MISNPLTLPLDSPLASLELAGGKGLSLARLSRAGFPVPGGWILTTQAYHAFVDFNGIARRIEDALAGLGADDLDRLEELSGRIRGWFAEGELPEEIRAAILAAHSAWMEVPVAVRSSATAEDLPGLSFAGQQETFLNVTGEEALLRAVVGCWSSLWTARAVSYRARNGVPQAGVGLAVVVQRMIESQASGVLFTANPLTGLITETVIDATLGLGEALVSGKVEPDHYVVDAYAGRITHKTLGAKALSIRSTAAGGTVTQDESASGIQALPDEQILALAQMGRRAAAEAGSPQDIEWAWAGGQLSLLQSRPITSLFPLPEGMSPEPLKVMLSFGAVQGINDPLTPLGRDMFTVIAASAAHLFRLGVTRETQNVFFSAGERAWVNLTTLIRNTIGRKGLHAGLGFGEPAVRQVVEALWDDPRLAPPHQGFTLRGIRQIASFMVPILGNILLNLAAPDARRKFIVGRAEQILVEMRARAGSLQGDRRERLEGLLRAYFDLIDHRLGPMFVRFLSGVASGILPWTVLNSYARQLSGQPEGKNAAGFQDLVLEISRGLPNNPTTEMDLELWQAAQAVRADPASREAFAGTPPVELARLYEAGGLPPAAQAAFDRFLARYGGRGLAEIDLGRPRWKEDPAHIFEVVSGYLLLENPDQAPDAVFARGAVRAGEAVDQLVQALRKTRRGWFKARVARFAASRARAMMGMRESPKFFVVRLLAIFRWALLDLGAEFVQAGELTQPDDLYYLTFSELEAFARSPVQDAAGGTAWPELIRGRRAAYEREMLRRQVPRLLLSDGRAFYEGVASSAEEGSTITGSPVSPGSAEGRVRVVLDPRRARLEPGEILVCPGTDPSWTPLFLTAAGLVMEVGGMMTHGSVVAREYGIPAVVGVHEATSRLKTGQRIRVDGTVGTITLLDADNQPHPV